MLSASPHELQSFTGERKSTGPYDILEAASGYGGQWILLATLATVYLQAVRVWVKEEADLDKAEEDAQKSS